MSKINYTQDQLKVIHTHKRNLLVSAAAGSGKTAVLVQRLIQMMMAPTSPISLDHLLVVTFTNAAAAEMRERVGEALYKAIEEDPSNAYLQQQLTLLPSASIITLHGFCLQVLREYFHKIQLDPSFRIGDEVELKLLQQETMEEVLELFYEEGTESFLELIEAYAHGKTDRGIEALILSVYTLSRSYVDAKKWRKDHVQMLNIHTLEAWFESPYMASIINQIKEAAMSLDRLIAKGLEQTQEDGRLIKMAETLSYYQEKLTFLLEEKNHAKLMTYFAGIGYPRSGSAKRGTEASVVEPVKGIIGKVKSTLKKLQEDYSLIYDETFIERMAISYKHMQTLCQVVDTYETLYARKKEGHNLIDFSDIEHFALEILYDGEEFSEVAKIYQEAFEEIMVDEYQDTSLIQEALIRSVSRNHLGNPNIFMVGDMKQSIYKFRLARPELFAEKYNRYTWEESLYQKIELHKNFRSRQSVIAFTNYLFMQIMSESLGDVVYDTHAQLNQGAHYKIEAPHYGTNLVLIELEERPQETKIEVYARNCALEIQRLMGQTPEIMIYDSTLKTERKIQFKDITILLRTMKKWSETFIEVFSQYNIPVESHTTTGYFDAIEIQVMLNVLKIINNPKQDIPFLSVLKSPLFKFTAEELVTLRLTSRETDFHTAFMLFNATSLLQNPLEKKVAATVEAIKTWRSLAGEQSIYDLVQHILTSTGYYDYVRLMVGGAGRQANLDMFLDQIYHYEQTSYQGLFNFIRYMAQTQKHSIDYGVASVEGSSVDQVSIMSMHKSKGLEFPVVILPGLSKQFNEQDIRQALILHQDWGFGTDVIDSDQQVIYPSPIKALLKNKSRVESKSEELRLFYVGITRAREKLILIGAVKDMDKYVAKWVDVLETPTVQLDPLKVLEARTYLDMVMLGCMRHKALRPLYQHLDYDFKAPIDLLEAEPDLTLDIRERDNQGVARVLEIDDTLLEGYKEAKDVARYFDFVYPDQALTNLHISQSVSELKKREEGAIIRKYSRQAYRPLFITGEQPFTGTEKGTIFHKVMEHIPFEKKLTFEDIQNILQSLVEKEIITKREQATIYIKAIWKLITSPLGKRLHEAAKASKLRKEQPFVMGISSQELTDTDTEDYVMIQGVIDVYFEEADGLVLLDYKTDYMKDQTSETLAKRYVGQMTYYKKALERSHKKSVKAIYLYAVATMEVVEVEM